MYGLVIPKVEDDKRKPFTVERLLRSLGASGKLTGFKYLVYIVEYILLEPDTYSFMMKEIYPSVGKQFNVNGASVEHAIRTVIHSCWFRSEHSVLDYIAGRHLEKMPTNSEFIDILVAFIKYQNEKTTE